MRLTSHRESNQRSVQTASSYIFRTSFQEIWHHYGKFKLISYGKFLLQFIPPWSRLTEENVLTGCTAFLNFLELFRFTWSLFVLVQESPQSHTNSFNLKVVYIFPLPRVDYLKMTSICRHAQFVYWPYLKPTLKPLFGFHNQKLIVW